MKAILALALVLSSVGALAQQMTLDPGETNNTGVQLSCQVSGSGGGGYAPSAPAAPPAPAAPVLTRVGHYRTTPDYSCLNSVQGADPKSMDNQISRCGVITAGRMNCDSTQAERSDLDQNCYNSLHAKETLPAAIHSDQLQDLKDACTITTYSCLRYQY